ncbi:molybdopterin-guanine dinucleotide biosynthesis protein B [Halomonas sp. DP8Y7-1]|uniref:molybdopterin-guanine dinucleotide biosynthesis protein B n=1 Tax=unclassified Halomonas TaxID=2609666 RepID=UPI001C93DC72|nr:MULTISPECIES: molybdopterin-guanine dinucleotide biosynthesis protein B [unclassified Halomonas]MBY5984484.1 molybdopterin-guanine dinucleotide biosynthesis protein B [Halomonas sp. DP5Y7-2]MBY6029950.1 molybdopterin-guanine dinucleotide biosynthesis protein B [Halomonas sp. DP8Y7-1]
MRSRLQWQPQQPVLGIAAWSGTGKTTLLERIVPMLKGKGLRVSVIKHAHHRFDVDQPGKDSHRLRMAGAEPVLIASRARVAMMLETPEAEEADLQTLLAMVAPLKADLTLVEGFKDWPMPKLELHRAALGKPLLATEDPWVQAVACDTPLSTAVETLDLNAHDQLVEWMLRWAADWSGWLATQEGR